MLEKFTKAMIIIMCLCGIVISCFGIPSIRDKMYGEEGFGRDIADSLFGEGHNVNYLIFLINISILIHLSVLMIFAILGNEWILVGLHLIPVTMVIVLLWLSYSYMENDIGIYYNEETNPEDGGLKKWLVKNSGKTMCTIFIVLYVFISVFAIANKYEYLSIPDIEKVDVLTKEEAENLNELNIFKLEILYYYMGMIATTLIIIITSFFSDQTSDSYQKIFCNTYHKSGIKHKTPKDF